MTAQQKGCLWYTKLYADGRIVHEYGPKGGVDTHDTGLVAVLEGKRESRRHLHHGPKTVVFQVIGLDDAGACAVGRYVTGAPDPDLWERMLRAGVPGVAHPLHLIGGRVLWRKA